MPLIASRLLRIRLLLSGLSGVGNLARRIARARATWRSISAWIAGSPKVGTLTCGSDAGSERSGAFCSARPNEIRTSDSICCVRATTSDSACCSQVNLRSTHGIHSPSLLLHSLLAVSALHRVTHVAHDLRIHLVAHLWIGQQFLDRVRAHIVRIQVVKARIFEDPASCAVDMSHGLCEMGPADVGPRWAFSWSVRRAMVREDVLIGGGSSKLLPALYNPSH